MRPGDTVFVTKYAMTRGVVQTTVRGVGNLIDVVWPKAPGGHQLFTPADVCTTEAEAHEAFEAARLRLLEQAQRKEAKAWAAKFRIVSAA